MKRSLLSSLFVAATMLTGTSSIVQAEQQQTTDNSDLAFGVHVHGHALLTMVLEGNEMQLAFQSAAHSVVGFENKPSTAEQKQEVAAAIAIFETANWFSVNAEANCELSSADASTDLNEPHAREGHAEFYANYQILCQRPARLTELRLDIFNLLPAVEQIDVQWIINGQQSMAKASPGNSTIALQ